MPRLDWSPCGPYHVHSAFDSGNCSRAELGASLQELHVWTSPDCEGSRFEAQSRTWFHFAVRGVPAGVELTVTVHNMNAQPKLFKHGHRPVFRNEGAVVWTRVLKGVHSSGTKEDDNFRITFAHRFDAGADHAVFFAFSFPFSYGELQTMLALLEAHHPPPARGTSVRPGSVYLHRQLLARSIERRRVDLVTISSTDGMGEERELPVDDACLFPEKGPRPNSFPGKPVVLVTARVHPGETPASHVANGLLSFLLRPDDPRARRLRDRFVFKLVCMLNPDGVFHGHYRSDTRGVNLNRFYHSPSPVDHPAVYAVRRLVQALHDEGRFFLSVDLHAHATKRGCFLYGNHIADDARQEANVLYAKLVAMNSQFVEFDGCVFSENSMTAADKAEGLSREGSSRVTIHHLTGSSHCYTLECNYNKGRAANVLREPSEGPLSPPLSRPGSPLPSYTPASWQEVGKALCCALLDLHGCNPRSRCVIACMATTDCPAHSTPCLSVSPPGLFPSPYSHLRCAEGSHRQGTATRAHWMRCEGHVERLWRPRRSAMRCEPQRRRRPRMAMASRRAAIGPVAGAPGAAPSPPRRQVRQAQRPRQGPRAGRRRRTPWPYPGRRAGSTVQSCPRAARLAPR